MNRNRIGQIAALVSLILAAIVALATGRPHDALDKVEAAVPLVEAVLTDTDTHTDEVPR